LLVLHCRLSPLGIVQQQPRGDLASPRPVTQPPAGL
jgi:hypothetical protein